MAKAKKTVKQAKILVQQISGLAGKPEKQRKMIVSLGLKKIGQVKELPDNQCVRGVAAKIPHLVRVIA